MAPGTKLSSLDSSSPSAEKSCHRQKNLHFPWDGSAHNTSCSACLGLQPTRPYFCMPVFPNTLRLSCVCITHRSSTLKTERWRVERVFWRHQEFCCLYQIRVKTFLPDKAIVTAPWWATNGPEPTSKPAKVDLKKKNKYKLWANCHHPTPTQDWKWVFLNPVSKLPCALLNRTVGLCHSARVNTVPGCFVL